MTRSLFMRVKKNIIFPYKFPKNIYKYTFKKSLTPIKIIHVNYLLKYESSKATKCYFGNKLVSLSQPEWPIIIVMQHTQFYKKFPSVLFLILMKEFLWWSTILTHSQISIL